MEVRKSGANWTLFCKNSEIWHSILGLAIVYSSLPSPANGPWNPDLTSFHCTHPWVFSKGAALWEKKTGLWTSILHCTTHSYISSKGATETSFQNIWSCVNHRATALCITRTIRLNCWGVEARTKHGKGSGSCRNRLPYSWRMWALNVRSPTGPKTH